MVPLLCAIDSSSHHSVLSQSTTQSETSELGVACCTVTKPSVQQYTETGTYLAPRITRSVQNYIKIEICCLVLLKFNLIHIYF